LIEGFKCPKPKRRLRDNERASFLKKGALLLGLIVIKAYRQNWNAWEGIWPLRVLAPKNLRKEAKDEKAIPENGQHSDNCINGAIAKPYCCPRNIRR
jgi:hypothetical protein